MGCPGQAQFACGFGAAAASPLPRRPGPEQLPASLCSLKAEGLAASSAPSQPLPQAGFGPGSLLLFAPGQYPPWHHPQKPLRDNNLAPALHKPQVALSVANTKPSPCSLGKALCLQIVQQKQREKEPFNLLSHFHTQASTRSLSQEVSALGKCAAIK